MGQSAELLSALRALECSSTEALIRFCDGDVYTLRVISMMHAEEGADFVAEVLQPVAVLSGRAFPAGSFINCLLGDVAEVIVGEGRIFSRGASAHER